ncbi:hypothetical protein ATK36_2545 [Amycolatopsis sulphurea]|uniref:Uncharacterized protein n=1 Tax=Amycolatopsis sulphurea TaxID=76022 RepID=A0A2A9FAH4_9PSEU|nr:hypothetical protein ATK36_2545 [Amycolatopsis sulphurea]
MISSESRGCRVIIDDTCPLDRLRPAAGDAEAFETRDHLALCARPVSGSVKGPFTDSESVKGPFTDLREAGSRPAEAQAPHTDFADTLPRGDSYVAG